jgi:hypothetical protein
LVLTTPDPPLRPTTGLQSLFLSAAHELASDGDGGERSPIVEIYLEKPIV